MSNDNTPAISTKRKHSDDISNEKPFSTLKKTRVEALSVNPSRVKWGSNSNPGVTSKVQTKMERRLEPIQPLLASLPQPLAIQFKEFATLILSRKIEIIHCNKRTQFTERNPDFYPTSILFEFELTSKDEFVVHDEFKVLRDNARQTVLDMKNSLRKTISELQVLEETWTTHTLYKEFINGLIDIFELYSSFTRESSIDDIIPYDNIEASEILLKKFFYKFCSDSNDDMYTFLHIKRLDAIKILNERKDKCPFLTSDNSDDAERKSDSFTEEAIDKIFPQIRIATIDLFNSYTQTMRVEEATAKTETLRKSKLKSSLAAEMAEIIAQEPSVDPKQLRALIDDRIKVNVNPTSILKRSDKKKNNKKLSKNDSSEAASSAAVKNNKKNKQHNKSAATRKASTSKKAQGSHMNSVEIAQLSSSSTATNTPMTIPPNHHPNTLTTPFAEDFIPSQAQLNHWNQQSYWSDPSRGRGGRRGGRGRGRGGRHNQRFYPRGGRGASHRGGRGRGRH